MEACDELRRDDADIGCLDLHHQCDRRQSATWRTNSPVRRGTQQHNWGPPSHLLMSDTFCRMRVYDGSSQSNRTDKRVIFRISQLSKVNVNGAERRPGLQRNRSYDGVLQFDTIPIVLPNPIR